MTQETQLSMQSGYQPAQIMTADPAAVAAAEAAKQRVQAAYIFAMHNPRKIEQSRQNILEICKRPRFAEKAEYSKPVGKDRQGKILTVEGPSVRLAEAIITEWGNISSDIQVVYEDENLRRIKVYLTDLQTNAQYSKEITIQKTVERKSSTGREVISERKNTYGDKVYIVKATDDEMYNKESALISKAVRNEGLRLIPSYIVEEALETCRETITKGIKEDPDAHKRKVLDSFKSIGVKVVDLEKYLKHAIDQASPAEIENLRKIYGSIKDGESIWADYIEETEKTKPATPAITREQLAEQMDKTSLETNAAKNRAELIRKVDQAWDAMGKTPKDFEVVCKYYKAGDAEAFDDYPTGALEKLLKTLQKQMNSQSGKTQGQIEKENAARAAKQAESLEMEKEAQK